MAHLPNRIFLTLLTLSLLALTIRELDYQQRSRSRKPDVTVYVAGEVHRPGSVSLPASARRMHAVTAAGGTTSRADLKSLEPARHLKDGETIWVAQRAEQSEHQLVKPPHPVAPTVRGGALKAKTSSVESLGRIDLNTATPEQLEGLPGIGPVLARRIVEKRNSQPSGTFATIEDLTTIRGIKRKTMVRLAPYLELGAYDR